MREELVQFVGVFFFSECVFHFAVVGSTLCLLWAGWGDISWASLLEEEHGGTTVESPPSSGSASVCSLCFRSWTDGVSSGSL